MRGTTERRIRLLITLCKRRHDTVFNLAFEFQVDEHTIRNDIDALSTDFPVYTVCGRHGGVYVEESYKLGMQYLTEREQGLLERISLSLIEEEKAVMTGIIKKFARPGGRKGWN